MILVPVVPVGSPGSPPPPPPWSFSVARGGHRDEDDPSIIEMHRRSSPGLLTASSAGPMPAPEDTDTVAAMAAAAAAATSEPLLCCL